MPTTTEDVPSAESEKKVLCFRSGKPTQQGRLFPFKPTPFDQGDYLMATKSGTKKGAKKSASKAGKQTAAKKTTTVDPEEALNKVLNPESVRANIVAFCEWVAENGGPTIKPEHAQIVVTGYKRFQKSDAAVEARKAAAAERAEAKEARAKAREEKRAEVAKRKEERAEARAQRDKDKAEKAAKSKKTAAAASKPTKSKAGKATAKKAAAKKSTAKKKKGASKAAF